MIRLEKDTVIKLHKMLSERTGGDPGIRDIGLLESALLSPFATFGGEDLYPTVQEKTARLGHSLIANHAFVDGNKRIGMLAMLVFANINGLNLAPPNEEVYRIGIAVASGEMGYDELLSRINEYSK